jgi:hypothetical protein
MRWVSIVEGPITMRRLLERVLEAFLTRTDDRLHRPIGDALRHMGAH